MTEGAKQAIRQEVSTTPTDKLKKQLHVYDVLLLDRPNYEKYEVTIQAIREELSARGAQ